MSDGVQFGLAALQERREAHRILWVITDGQPNDPHGQVMKSQIRMAKEAGIHVIGVGVGRGAQYVERVFPDSVYSENISTMPHMIMQKLNEVCDFTGRFRGKKIQGFDQRMVGRVTR